MKKKKNETLFLVYCWGLVGSDSGGVGSLGGGGLGPSQPW
jgi:hypothetical protein